MKSAKNIEELVVWQLASRLRALVDDMVQQPRARMNRRLCEQIRNSSESVPANLAEGFGRYYPTENARFVRIAKASLTETQNHLMAGKNKYWKPDDFEQAWRLSCRTMKAIVPYLLYLESCEGEVPAAGSRTDPAPQHGEPDAKETGSS